jgi:hypothetical protein
VRELTAGDAGICAIDRECLVTCWDSLDYPENALMWRAIGGRSGGSKC